MTGLFAQVSQGAGAVGIILVVKQHSGSLALAGAVVGTLSIVAGLARPIQGRLIDAHGSAGVMAVCGVVHPAAMIAIVALTQAGAIGWPLVVAGGLAGLALPPVSTSMRVVWGEAASADQRTLAYSLTYLTQETAILVGPLILAAVVAIASAAAALTVIAVVSAVGTLSFAASLREPRQSGPLPAEPRSTALRSGGVRALVAVGFLVGGVVGGIEVAAPAFAVTHGVPAIGGVLIAALSVGGIAGAALYGGRKWRSAPAERLVALLAALALAVVLELTMDSIVEVGILLLLAGAALNPSLTTISLLVDEHTPGRTAAEAVGWLSTGLAAGAGVTSAIAGALAGHHNDWRAAFLVAAAAGAAATALAALLRTGRLGRRREGSLPHEPAPLSRITPDRSPRRTAPVRSQIEPTEQ